MKPWVHIARGPLNDIYKMYLNYLFKKSQNIEIFIFNILNVVKMYFQQQRPSILINSVEYGLAEPS